MRSRHFTAGLGLTLSMLWAAAPAAGAPGLRGPIHVAGDATELQPLGIAAAAYPVGLAFVDVGQGAATFAYGARGTVVAVDAGTAQGADAVLAELERRGIRRIDLWVLTHYDADHIGGLPVVRAGADGIANTNDDIEVTQVWDRGRVNVPDTQVVSGYLQLVARGLPAREVTVGDRFEREDLWVRVVGRGSAHAAGENGRGLALCIGIGETRTFLGGDLPASAPETLDAATRCAGDEGRVDVWVVNHHGASDGSSVELVERLDPGVAIISAGRDNDHCHPAPSTLAQLNAHSVWISGGAGRSPLGACSPIASNLASTHHWAAGGAYLALGASQLSEARAGRR